MNITETTPSIKASIRQTIETQLIEGSKELFNKFDMDSFGWHQCVERWVDGRGVTFIESLQKPDISGALGEMYYDRDGRQQEVASFLGQFDMMLLTAAYGDSVDVTVYRDGTVEVTNDTYRSVAFEL